MVCCSTACVSLFIGTISFIIYKVVKYFRIPPTPVVEEKWWGTGDPGKEDTSIEPFEIRISDEILKDLKYRLENAIPFQEPIEDAKQHYGMNTKLLKTIVDFWKTDYNWREREKFLNQYPQFRVSVQGLKIHYLHVKPENEENLPVRPLLLLHGWPGSVREFYEMIPLLTKPKGKRFVFEIIAPSLPGFGFSEATTKKGLGTVHMAVIFKNLMKKIGFQKFYIQGGDWGGILVSQMSVLFPYNILGMHSNMCFAMTPLANLKSALAIYLPSVFSSFFLTEEEKRYPDMYALKQLSTFRNTESGYFSLQSTKPDTVGVGLRDSPAGLAAYILEKFTTWTDINWQNREDGGLTLKYTYTNLLDNVMIYWVTRTITTSVRIYYEHSQKSNTAFQLDLIPIEVPSGCARFWKDAVSMPESILKDKYMNIVHCSSFDAGHFAAFEVPDLLAEDIFKFVEKVENSQF